MKDKILFLLDLEWLHFGIAKFISDLHDCELFAIIDVDNNSNEFYLKQKIIPFTKFWFYRDFLPDTYSNVDIKFLKMIEEKYDIRLWQIAYSERFFSSYNTYHTFSDTEIQSILASEAKLFDSILEEINPDFLVTKLTDSHQSELLLRMCKAKNIDVLMMASTRLHNRCTIFGDYDKFDLSLHNMENKNPRSKTELKTLAETYSKSKSLKPAYSKTESFTTRIKKYYRYLISLDNTSTNYYAHYGKNTLSVISQLTFLKRWYRKKFIDKNLSLKTDITKPYVYFPLHVEPERQLLLVAPYFDDQLQIIRSIAKSLPIDHRLVVKEHWMMLPRGWRDISYYKQILELPNVELLHPSVDGEYLLKNSSLVITISGTTGFEAAFHNKPAITFAENSYCSLPSVYRIKSIEDLPDVIRSLIGKNIDYSKLDSYIDLIEKNSFEFDLRQLGLDFKEHFSLNLNTIKSNIDEVNMNSFLTNHEREFSFLAKEHIKKIQKYKSPK